ncbi:hypothetical protein ACOMHN_011022 [Nucella lapillus]
MGMGIMPQITYLTFVPRTSQLGAVVLTVDYQLFGQESISGLQRPAKTITIISISFTGPQEDTWSFTDLVPHRASREQSHSAT